MCILYTWMQNMILIYHVLELHKFIVNLYNFFENLWFSIANVLKMISCINDSTLKYAKLLKVLKIGAFTLEPPSYSPFTKICGKAIQVITFILKGNMPHDGKVLEVHFVVTCHSFTRLIFLETFYIYSSKLKSCIFYEVILEFKHLSM